MQLKPVSEQVIVVVGAGSGLGFAIARAAAKAGAAVALADTDETAVRNAAAELAKAGARVHPIVVDGATEEGCQRIGRAVVARFDRIDGWVDATGADAGLAHAAQGLVRHMAARGGRGALVAFAKRLPRAAAAELRKGHGSVAPTLIVLPRGWPDAASADAAVRAALYALSHPMGRMAVAARGRRLTRLTEASKHRGVMVGVGLVALAGAAVWLGRGRIAGAASAARPGIAKAVRPVVIGAVRKRPLAAARLAAKHPREAARLARLLS